MSLASVCDTPLLCPKCLEQLYTNHHTKNTPIINQNYYCTNCNFLCDFVVFKYDK